MRRVKKIQAPVIRFSEKPNDSIILGAGITGLAAGYTSGFPIFEAEGVPGGLCMSYYRRPEGKGNLKKMPVDGEVYRFEKGGGHWIFGANPAVSKFIRTFSPVGKYARRSSVYFSKREQVIPYPIQRHIQFFDRSTAGKIQNEMRRTSEGPSVTMKEWLTRQFGPTFCRLFFHPFHERYTAGLYDRIAPQDQYKSPAKTGAGKRSTAKKIGYNAVFVYPKNGLDEFIRAVANQCNISYQHRVVRIDTKLKEIYFADRSARRYKNLLATLPLNEMVKLTGLNQKENPDPYTSVLVLNIGAIKQKNCPNDHWLYVPDSDSGFYRVGFYSNVDASFLPTSSREREDRVSLYVERAFEGGRKPTDREIRNYINAVVKELQEWGFIKDAEVIDLNWIQVAYTWSWPGSPWRANALALLEKNNIYPLGRYGRWRFQGIAESIDEGIAYGT